MELKEFNESVSQLSFDHSVGIDSIIWLAGQQGRQSDDFEDLVNYDVDQLCKLLELDEDHFEDADPESVISDLTNLGFNGFLVLLSAPVPVKFYKDGGFMFAGTRRLKWFYVESMDEIKDKIQLFAESVIEDELAKVKQ